jgi:uncharacterized protein RhaS with RHS repeats
VVISGYRYYSPDLGRWLNRDPLGEKGGINLYLFVSNSSLDKWDFLGRSVHPLGVTSPDKIIEAMKKNKYGRESVVIGKVSSKGKGSVFLNTQLGTRRLVDMHYSEQLPRIC